MKRILLITLSLVITNVLLAQSWKDKLNRAGDLINQKLDDKINQKIDEGIDNGFNQLDSLFSREKQQNTHQESKQISDNEETTTSLTESENNDFSNNEIVLSSNIKSEADKEKMENLIRKESGVNNVSIDTDTGKIYINCTPSLKNEIIALIKNNGFKITNTKN